MSELVDHAPESLLRVGQLAEQSGKTVRAIHFYEELGLLTPARRTKGGFRLYDPDAVFRIQWIDRLQELGFSLPEIREFLQDLRSAGSGPAAMYRLRDFYARKLDETRAALSRLRSLEQELQESMDYLSACRVCAPHTSRSACRTCDEELHHGQQPPPLVAAVHDPV